MHQRGRLILLCLGALFPALTLIGCASAPPAPVASDSPFAGPPVHIDSSGPEHIAVVQAPTPGWEVTLSQIMPGYHHRAAFITLRRPYPGAIYAQVVVEQRVSLGIPTHETLRLYAREVVFEEPRMSELPYSFVAEAATTPVPNPP